MVLEINFPWVVYAQILKNQGSYVPNESESPTNFPQKCMKLTGLSAK